MIITAGTPGVATGQIPRIPGANVSTGLRREGLPVHYQWMLKARLPSVPCGAVHDVAPVRWVDSKPAEAGTAGADAPDYAAGLWSLHPALSFC